MPRISNNLLFQIKLIPSFQNIVYNCTYDFRTSTDKIEGVKYSESTTLALDSRLGCNSFVQKFLRIHTYSELNENNILLLLYSCLEHRNTKELYSESCVFQMTSIIWPCLLTTSAAKWWAEDCFLRDTATDLRDWYWRQDLELASTAASRLRAKKYRLNTLVNWAADGWFRFRWRTAIIPQGTCWGTIILVACA